jgi:hypothetical protein
MEIDPEKQQAVPKTKRRWDPYFCLVVLTYQISCILTWNEKFAQSAQKTVPYSFALDHTGFYVNNETYDVNLTYDLAFSLLSIENGPTSIIISCNLHQHSQCADWIKKPYAVNPCDYTDSGFTISDGPRVACPAVLHLPPDMNCYLGSLISFGLVASTLTVMAIETTFFLASKYNIEIFSDPIHNVIFKFIDCWMFTSYVIFLLVWITSTTYKV